jgi:hypothetical protein
LIFVTNNILIVALLIKNMKSKKKKTTSITDWFTQSTIGNTLGCRVIPTMNDLPLFSSSIVNVATPVARQKIPVEKEEASKEHNLMKSSDDELEILKVTPGKKRPPPSPSSKEEVTFIKVTPPKKKDWDPVISLDVKSPPKKKTRKEKEEVVVELDAAIDLSQRNEESMMPGMPLAVIKKQNMLYFTYNPMGYDPNFILPRGYCRHCRSPTNYCAQSVFGENCKRQAEHIIYNIRGGADTMDKDDALQVFEEIYTEAVHNKVMENEILFHDEYDKDEAVLNVYEDLRKRGCF